MTKAIAPRFAAVLVLVAAMLGVSSGAPSQAAACSTRTGVTVVVDFGTSTKTACAPGSYSTGLAALQGAGFTAVRASAQPGYFLCRINGIPSSDPCVRASPTTAYWSIWSAARGGTWRYTQSGVASYVPTAGSVLGFHFGTTVAPRAAVPAKLAAAPAVAQPTAAARQVAPQAPATSSAVAHTSAEGAQGAPSAVGPSRDARARTASASASPRPTPSASGSIAATSAAPSLRPDSPTSASASSPGNDASASTPLPGARTGSMQSAGVGGAVAASRPTSGTSASSSTHTIGLGGIAVAVALAAVLVGGGWLLTRTLRAR